MSASQPTDFIPFGRPLFGDEEIAAVAEVLRSGWIGMGEQTIAFERELAAALEAEEVVAVSSCTGALFLSLIAAGIRDGDEVICPSLTWCSTANAALYLRARPVFCDIDADTLTATPETILARLSPRTRAVMVVHYGGLTIDVPRLRALLPPHVAIIEDAAHAFGARYPNGARVGSSGHLTCFSFYANKNLSTGEGGAIALRDKAVAERLRTLRQHAMPSHAWARYQQPTRWPEGVWLTELGYKLNYTDLQASIGRVQLRRQAEFTGRRAAIAAYYAAGLSERLPEITPQAELLSERHARHLFVVRLPAGVTRAQRNTLVQAARTRGVGLAVHYLPLHRVALYGSEDVLPVTDAVVDRLVTLPIGVAMTDEDAHRAFAVFEDEIRTLRAQLPGTSSPSGVEAA